MFGSISARSAVAKGGEEETPNAIYVIAYNNTGQAADKPFHLVVHC